MTPVTLTIPGLKLVGEANARENWRARSKRAKAQRSVVRRVLDAAVGRMAYQAPLAVTITRIAPRAFDPGDNLNMSAKHVRDEIAAWLGVNDRDDSRVRYAYAQERAGVREYGVRVRIERVVGT